MSGSELAGPPRTPHANLGERPDEPKGLQVAAGLDARSQDRENGSLPARERVRRDRRDRGGPHLGDEAPVHRHERLSRLRPEEDDRRVMGGDVPIVREERHELGAESRPGRGRHDAQESLGPGDGKDRAKRLYDPTLGEIREGLLHGRDEPIHGEEAPDVLLVEDQAQEGLVCGTSPGSAGASPARWARFTTTTVRSSSGARTRT